MVTAWRYSGCVMLTGCCPVCGPRLVMMHLMSINILRFIPQTKPNHSRSVARMKLFPILLPWSVQFLRLLGQNCRLLLFVNVTSVIFLHCYFLVSNYSEGYIHALVFPTQAEPTGRDSAARNEKTGRLFYVSHLGMLEITCKFYRRTESDTHWAQRRNYHVEMIYIYWMLCYV